MITTAILFVIGFVLGWLVPRDAFPWMKRFSAWMMLNRDNRQIAWLFGAIAFAVLVLLLATGCAKQRAKEDQTPAGSSALTKADAAAVAQAYAARHRGAWAYVAPSGSMAPVIDSRSVLLLEPYTGQPINAGDIVCFDRGDAPNVCHRVIEVKDGAFYVSGDNNLWPDGWHKLTAIKHRVAGIIFTRR